MTIREKLIELLQQNTKEADTQFELIAMHWDGILHRRLSGFNSAQDSIHIVLNEPMPEWWAKYQ